MKKSANALNRSRDLSADMSQYDEQLIETLRKQMDEIIKENQSLGDRCQVYQK